MNLSGYSCVYSVARIQEAFKMQSNITMKVDTKQFDRVLDEYMRYTSRSITEAVNSHAYYAARNATQTTYAAEASKIKEDLQAASSRYPSVPLAAILVNRDRKKKGKRGLRGEAMRTAVEKFIKVRQSHRNFLRSGWIPAIKQLASLVPKKRGARIPPGTEKKGRDFGGATPAKVGEHPIAVIWNSAVGKNANAKAIRYIEEGIERALDQEVESMKQYILKKQEQAAAKFN